VPFFIAEHGLNEITRLQRSNQLWVELTVPPRGAPRAVRIGVMRHGRIEPFALE
jgi:hypothetical protein